MSKRASGKSLTESQKEKYVVDRIKYWTSRLNIGGKSVEVSQFNPADDEDEDDEQPQPYLTSLEESIVTALEHALMGDKFEPAKDIAHKTRGQVLADVDDSMAEYAHFKIRIYPALMSYDGDDFRTVTDSVMCHECIHMALHPYTTYAYSVCEKLDKRRKQ